MSRYFCPFIKDECNQECVFYNNAYDEEEQQSCSLYDAANMIYSLGFDDTKLSDFVENIDSNLYKVSQNTGTDQTDSSYIRSSISNIESTVDEINDKLKK